MEIEQYQILTECLQLCGRLLDKMEQDRDGILGCLQGELCKAYLEANERATQELVSIRNRLNEIAL